MLSFSTEEHSADPPQDADRFVELQSNMRSAPTRKETGGFTKILKCVGCSIERSDVRRRLCTGGEPLCVTCRASPFYRLMSESLLRTSAPGLEMAYYPRPVGYTVNGKNPAFRPQRMYLWADIAERCAALGIDIPE